MTEPRAIFADKPTLVGEKVLLRPVRLREDLPLLRVRLQDKEILRWTSGSRTPVVPEWDEAPERRTADRYRTRHCWRIDTADGPIAITLSNAFPEDGHPGVWRAI
ncbi:hypothetical protein [Kitasatospora griseola]|uniref:hypothetical protein n=1 Tax=Kitasatospora griseola TaxID=2064 RepID=UPI0034401CA4